MKSNNPWMSILSQFIISEPFIITGTSLDEIDLRYYLSFRDETAAAGVRAPSVLIEPYPDAMTEHKCQQYGLILFKGTTIEFFDRIRGLYPNVPRLDSFVPVTAATMFSPNPDASELARFLGDFSFVERATLSTENVESKFFFGGKPSWPDLERHYDIDRACNRELIGHLRNFIVGKGATLLHIISDEAGSGKTTCASRVLYDLAVDGAIVLVHTSESRPDVDRTAKLLNYLKKRAIVYFDRGAAAAPWVALLHPLLEKDKVCFVLADRSYREEHIKVVTSGLPHHVTTLGKARASEYKKIIKNYLNKGLIGNRQAQTNPGQFANLLRGDPLALGVCRILNDFRPIDRIAETLLVDASDIEKRLYLTAALASYCDPSGVRLSILCQVAPVQDIRRQSKLTVGLPLSLTSGQGTIYVEPSNRLLSERVLLKARSTERRAVSWCFFLLGEKLAAYVSPQTIRQQTPETRTAGRLFNYDEVLQVLMPGEADEFYAVMEQWWGWNSRYWEQKALLRLAMHTNLGRKHVFSDYLRDAVAHARHAKALELHQFPLTTLGRVLMAQYDVKGENKLQLFGEAFNLFDEAIGMEAYKSRVTIYPVMGIMQASQKMINDGEKLSDDQRVKLRDHNYNAQSAHPNDPVIRGLVKWLSPAVS